MKVLRELTKTLDTMGMVMAPALGRVLGCVSNEGQLNLRACAAAVLISRITNNVTGGADFFVSLPGEAENMVGTQGPAYNACLLN